MDSSPPPDLVGLSSEDEDDLDEADERLLGTSRCPDLFSEKMFDSAEECFDHCREVHGFDVQVLMKRHSMDFFSYIRLINFVRSEKPSPCFVMSLSSDCHWSDAKFMKPVLEDDPLLMVDTEQLGTGDSGIQEDCDSMKETLLQLRQKLQDREDQLRAALEDMEQMRAVTRRLVLDDDDREEAASSARRGESQVNGSYAESYAHFGIHHEMLSDKVRTEAYRDAVALNSDQFKGKRVLDLGCGTGILSMFCAKLGEADRVVGVDMSAIAYQAMDIVRENGLEDNITIMKGRVEDLDLDRADEQRPFDVLISEWMGYFLLFEGMLDSIIVARDRYLTKTDGKPGSGKVLPNRCTMHLVGVSDEQRHRGTVGYFEDVYGFRMSCLRDPMVAEASVEVVPNERVATTTSLIHCIDTSTCTLEHTEFRSEFELEALADCTLTSLAGYFDAHFDLNVPVSFTTGPSGPTTHWKQTVFYLKDKVPLKRGEKVAGTIDAKRPKKDPRSLRITLKISTAGLSCPILQTYLLC